MSYNYTKLDYFRSHIVDRDFNIPAELLALIQSKLTKDAISYRSILGILDNHQRYWNYRPQILKIIMFFKGRWLTLEQIEILCLYFQNHIKDYENDRGDFNKVVQLIILDVAKKCDIDLFEN
jgi:hypothetical protein